MKKSKFIELMNKHGDALVTYVSPVSRKHKYVMATLDFNTKYLEKRPKPKVREIGSELIFCWDTDKFKTIKPEDVVNIVPMSTVVHGKR